MDSGAVAGPWFDGLGWRSFFPSVGTGIRIYDAHEDTYWDVDLEYGFQVTYSREAGVRLILAAAAF